MRQRHTRVWREVGWSWLSKIESMPDSVKMRKKAGMQFDAGFSSLQFLWDARIDPFKEAR